MNFKNFFRKVFLIVTLCITSISSYAAVPLNSVNWVPTVAALATLGPSSGVNLNQVYVQCYSATTSIGKCIGGGTVFWAPNDTNTPTVCNHFAVTGITTGRWKWVSEPEFDVTHCGVTFTSNVAGTGSPTDDSAAWTAAFAQGIPLFAPAPIGNFQPVSKVSTLFTINENLTSLDCHGAAFDARSLSANNTYLFTLTSTNDSGASQGVQIPSHPFSNCGAYGPASTTGVNLFYLQSVLIGSTPLIFGTTITNFTAADFNNFMTTGSGVVNLTINNPFWSLSNSNPRVGTFIYVTSGNDSGEAWRVNGGFVTSANHLVVDKGCNSGTAIKFYDTSFDAGTSIVTGDSGSGPDSDGACLNVDYQGWVEDPAGTVNFINLKNTGVFNWTAGRLVLYDTSPFSSTTSIGNSTGGAGQGGVRLQNIEVYPGTTALATSEFFVSGTGPFSADNVKYNGGNNLPVVSSQYNNLVQDFNFTASPATTGWTLASGATYDTSTTPPTGATGTIKLTGSASTEGDYTMNQCPVGKVPEIQFKYKTSGLVAASATFQVIVEYQNRSGTQIGGDTAMGAVTLDSSSYIIYRSSNAIAAPPGSTLCKFRIELITSTGTPIVNFGRVWIGSL